jgi:hypothetical protein
MLASRVVAMDTSPAMVCESDPTPYMCFCSEQSPDSPYVAAKKLRESVYRLKL